MTAFAQPLDRTPPNVPTGLAAELAQVIRDAAEMAPRSQQRHIGPSEVGVECPRRLVYKLLDWPSCNTSDPLPALMGTAMHGWLAGQFSGDRWLVEHRVQVRQGLSGTVDLYDRQTQTVIDWKCPGATVMTEVRRGRVSEQYRKQAHLYGLGLENEGETPATVALAFLPRAGYLSGMHLWSEPYDRQVALDALDRMDTLLCLADALNVDTVPQLWPLIPAKPADYCRYCPNFRPYSTDLSAGCPGDSITAKSGSPRDLQVPDKAAGQNGKSAAA